MTGDAAAAAQAGPCPCGLKRSTCSAHALCRPAPTHEEGLWPSSSSPFPDIAVPPLTGRFVQSRHVPPGRAGTHGTVCHPHAPTTVPPAPPSAVTVTSGHTVRSRPWLPTVSRSLPVLSQRQALRGVHHTGIGMLQPLTPFAASCPVSVRGNRCRQRGQRFTTLRQKVPS